MSSSSSSSSRLSQRSVRKQEKFRRHIASLNASEGDGKPEPPPKEEAPKPAATGTLPSRYLKPSSRPKPSFPQRYLSPSASEEPSEAPPSSLYPSQKGAARSLPTNPSEDSVEAKAAGPKSAYRNKMARRTGRSLTRSTPNSRSSSVNSENSQEPGRIRARSRTGRSLTRASSASSPAPLPRSRSSSINNNKPPMVRASSGEAESSTPAVASSVTCSAMRSSRFRNRSLSRNRRSLSQDPTPDNTVESSSSSEPPPAVSKIRPTSGRSPFSRLMAEKQVAKAKLKATRLEPKKASNATDDSTKEETSATETAADESSPCVDATSKETNSDEEGEPGRIPTVSTAESEGESPTPDDAPEPSKKEEIGKAVLFDEYKEPDSEEDAKNISVLSAENVEKHGASADIVDEYGDPPLEEMESEVSLGPNNALQNYLPNDSILNSFAVTSPIHEAKDEESVFTEHAVDGKHDDDDPAKSVDVHEEKKETDSQAGPAGSPEKITSWGLSNSQFSNLVASVTKSSDDDMDMLFDTASWVVTGKESGFSKVSNSRETTDESKEKATTTKDGKKTKDEFDMFDTSSWAAAGTEDGFSNAEFSSFNKDIDAERNFVNMMKEEMKFRTLTDEERDMVFEAQKAIHEAEEQAEAERNAIQKDDEPLIGQLSNSTDGNSESASLESRLKIYATVEPDEDSVDESGESDGTDENSSDGDGDTEVDYVDQCNEDMDDNETDVAISPDANEITLVSSNDVPTLEVAASAAAEQSVSPQDSFVIPQTLSELKMTMPPPPPPPGRPKKRKSKKKKKSTSRSKDNHIPLIPPPPEEKIQKWEDEQQRAHNYVSAIKERLEDSETKALDSPSEYFHFKPVDESKGGAGGAKDVQLTVDVTIEENSKTDGEVDEEDAGLEVPEQEPQIATEESAAAPEVDVIDKVEDTSEESAGSTESEEEKEEVATSVSANGEDEQEDEADSVSKFAEEVRRQNEQVVSLAAGSCESEKEKEDDSISKFAEEVRRQNEQTVSLLSAPKANLWQKEVADAMGLVERLEDEYDQDFPGINTDLTPFSEAFSDDEIGRKISEEQAPNRYKIPGVDSSVQENPSDTHTSQDSKDLMGADLEEKTSVENVESVGETTQEGLESVGETMQEEVESVGETTQEEVESVGETTTQEEVESVGETTQEEIEPDESKETDASGDDMLVKDRLLSVDTSEDSLKEEKQESMFATPKSVLKPLKLEKRQSSNGESILTGYMMADKVAMASSAAANTFENRFTPRGERKGKPKKLASTSTETESLMWFSREVLKEELSVPESAADISETARSLLKDREHFNSMCRYIAERINEVSFEIKPSLRFADSTLSSFDQASFASKSMTTASSKDSAEESVEQPRVLLKPLVLSNATMTLSQKYLAANFVSFIFMASKLAKVKSPFGDSNPFLAMIVSSSMKKTIDNMVVGTTMQELLFAELDGKAEILVEFVHKIKSSCDAEMTAFKASPVVGDDKMESMEGKEIENAFGVRNVVPESHPSPFEASILEVPRIVAAVLSFLGDPVAVCQMKTVNTSCRRIIAENEHVLMQDAVRVGGIDPSLRPAFWMWIALEKSDLSIRENKFTGREELMQIQKGAEDGKWHHVINRDVERSFGNMPPHKSGAKCRTDSIVTALVTWGQNRIMKRGVKGGGEPVPTPEVGRDKKQKARTKSTNISSPPWDRKDKSNDVASVRSETSDSPGDTVSNWSAVSPKGSFVGSANDSEAFQDKHDMDDEEIALCGNSLSPDAKADLQKKLSFILHSLAAAYKDIGYCQGMDYVVAHLLRNLQDTIRWKAANKTLPSIISTASSVETVVPVDAENIEAINKDIDFNLVVEETVIRMMDTFFVNYNLRHMYWPELRCLKTCCRVFERLIQLKLPVLADHFEHHDLNIGLFALGWFQTLFLYLPSMPSATVCHMWDIWLVERSFKIFFRVGTAILFLSQPILLNHELEGMMTYLNTIPDATLLRPDILIPCALNIKVTNRMLQELEDEVMKNPY